MPPQYTTIIGIALNLLSMVFAYLAYQSWRRWQDTHDVETIKAEGALTRRLIVGTAVAYLSSISCFFVVGAK